MITYFDRLNAGLQQLMAGARKFALKHITRDDLFALTREAADVSGISYVMEADKEEAAKILRSSSIVGHGRPLQDKKSATVSLDQGILT